MLMQLPNTYSGNEVLLLKSQAKYRIVANDVNRKIILKYYLEIQAVELESRFS
jgi:hypothetical protein